MAIAVTNLQKNLAAGITVSTSAGTVPSATYTAGNYYVLTIFGLNPTYAGPMSGSLSGGGVTWSSIATTGNMNVFGGRCATTATGTLAIRTWTGSYAYQYILDEVTGVSAVSTVVNFASSNATGSTVTCTLASVAAGNGVYMVGGST